MIAEFKACRIYELKDILDRTAEFCRYPLLKVLNPWGEGPPSTKTHIWRSIHCWKSLKSVRRKSSIFVGYCPFVLKVIFDYCGLHVWTIHKIPWRSVHNYVPKRGWGFKISTFAEIESKIYLKRKKIWSRSLLLYWIDAKNWNEMTMIIDVNQNSQ